jgi:site-specific DNA-methyltransferase (adenine-specific)
VLDRLTNGWEYVWHLVRQPDYFYDLDAIRVPLRSSRKPRLSATPPAWPIRFRPLLRFSGSARPAAGSCPHPVEGLHSVRAAVAAVKASRQLPGGQAPAARPVPCGCKALTRPGLVLDPFAGSGTTLRVARRLGRDALGIELNPEFARLARERAGFDSTLAEAA